MQLFHKYHHNKIYKLFHTDLWLFDVSVWLHVLARSMISIFIPIFLLRMGWSIGHVILYYLIFNIFDAPLNFVAKWLTYKIGAKKVIIMGSLAYICFLALLYNLAFGIWWILVLMALFEAIYDTCYWVAHIYFFMKCDKNKRNISKSVGILYIAKRIAGILAPALGALVLIFFHQKILILVSITILALSIWPLFKIKHSKDKPKDKPKSLKEYFQGGSGLKEYIIQGIYSFHNVAEGIIWPIFIYTLFKTIESVAIISIIVSISTIIFTYLTGKIKRGNRSKVMAVGAFFIALTWILRLTVDNNMFYYITIFMVGLFAVLVSLPLDSNLFEKGEKKDALAAAAYRNFFSMSPRIFLFGGLYLLLETFKVSFVAATVSMLVIVAINYVFLIKKPIRNLKQPYP